VLRGDSRASRAASMVLALGRGGDEIAPILCGSNVALPAWFQGGRQKAYKCPTGGALGTKLSARSRQFRGLLGSARQSIAVSSGWRSRLGPRGGGLAAGAEFVHLLGQIFVASSESGYGWLLFSQAYSPRLGKTPQLLYEIRQGIVLLNVSAFRIRSKTPSF
jgi:hypothetical protein